MGKDWTGNQTSVFATLGAKNYAEEERQGTDYYATAPRAVEMLLKLEKFQHTILEPACGEGHISKVLKSHGHNVLSYDLYDRGYGCTGVDFLKIGKLGFGCDIITNPPYKYASEFIKHALELVGLGAKVAMLLKLQFLEGVSRKKLFLHTPPKYLYVSSGRLICAKNGDFEKYKGSNAVAYGWYVWQKGYTGEPTIRWFN